MIKSLIDYFCKKHLLANMITFLMLIGGIVAWNSTNKEELPDITFNSIHINTVYPGSSAEDVEFYVSQPIEEVLQSINGVKKISSSSSPGRSYVNLEIDSSIKDIQKVVTEVQNQVNSVRLPEEIYDEPRVRVWETSKKAIIDIAFYDKSKKLLDVKSRMALQQVVRSFENQMLAQKEIFELRRDGYLIEEIKINAIPERFRFFEIPLSTIANEIQRNHVRSPSGTLKSGSREQITLLSELKDQKSLEKLTVYGGFDSKPVKLKSIATVKDSFEDSVSIYKVNGREAIILNVVKNSNYGILESLEKVREIVAQYENIQLKDTSIAISLLDDESINIRNRLDIVSSNGILGFILILLTLFIFLNKEAGFWVAIGIPFTLSFTLITGYFIGFTINGITLSATIIVLGIVVDDAIIVAENISQKLHAGLSIQEAVVEGSHEVFAPVLASILTTCVAFIPLLLFTGRFSNFIKFIPPIIFIMLFASLLESFLLLPAHLSAFPPSSKKSRAKHWFDKVETFYQKRLLFILKQRYLFVGIFIILIIGTALLAKNTFKFVLLTDEESTEIVISGFAKGAKTPQETAMAIQIIEDYLEKYLGKEGIATRSRISMGRRGDSSIQNRFQITLEIVPFEKRKKSADDLIEEIKSFLNTQETLHRIQFRKRRWGQSSGSLFEIVIAENDNNIRDQVAQELIESLEKHPNIINPEEDSIPTKKEYLISFKQDLLKQLSVNPGIISNALRTILNGKRLYTFYRNDEEIEVILTVDEKYRENISEALKVPIVNNQRYLIPLEDLIDIESIQAKNSIRRQNMKRTSYVYADIKKGSKQSPLEIATEFETQIFPQIIAKFPSSQLFFEGEILDSRESKQDLVRGLFVTIALIYLVLILLFNSIFKPLRILFIIPFGLIGVVLAFYLHGKILFGFYAAIGTLGMLGVVVNDAIVMMNKLDKQVLEKESLLSFTSKVASTRLRAIILTTLTTVAGVMPTAYGIGGSDSMLADMMLSLGWGLIFGTLVTLVLTPCIFVISKDIKHFFNLSFIKKSKRSVLLILLCFLPNTLLAKDTTLSLENFIQLASKNDPRFHAILIDQLKLRYQQDLFVDQPEFLISLLSGYELDAESLKSPSSIRLNQTLPSWGQAYSFDYRYLGSNSPENQFSFTFSQDIARNAFGQAIKLDQKIQTIQTELMRYQIVEAYEDYLAKLINLYYTWLRQYESYQLALSSYAENSKVFESILKRQEKKVADDTDVNKLKLQIVAKEEQVILFKKRYLETSRQIRNVIRSQTQTLFKPNTDIILDKLPKKNNTHYKNLQKNRSFSMLDLLTHQKDLEVKRYAKALLPSIKASYSLTKKDQSDSNELGFSFAFPTLNKKAKAIYKSAKIDQQKQLLESDSSQNTLLVTIENLYYSLLAQNKLVMTAINKRKLAQAILNNESENYTFGKIDLNDYIQAVNRFDATRFDEIDQKISFQQLMIEWKRLTDVLVNETKLLDP